MNREDAPGALWLGGGRCEFQLWAPRARRVEVHFLAPRERIASLLPGKRGHHRGVLEGVEPGSLYRYRLDGNREYPDPASRFQPQGVHGPSQVLDSYFGWQDAGWFGLPLRDFVLYELHVGTFTAEGTFEAAIPRLKGLQDLGITAVELMPVAQFPGERNWGYDGVYPFAVQKSYGGPEGLKRLVDACHRLGMAAVLDVVYNHLGPEGNYLGNFGPYFTERYRTPWGPALNFDGPDSDEVRRFFVDNALYWITEFHFDALRLDAVHAILDHSPVPFLEDLAAAVHERAERLNRRIYLMPESAANDPRNILPPELGGYGLDAQWNDDFHHCLHTLLTGEQAGYYRDFGRLEDLAKAFREGFVYSGQYSAYRRRRHGRSSRRVPVQRFIVFGQNHDQVGNRMLGERLSRLVSFEALKLAAGSVLLSPFLPLLFMGEEYGETAPFPYFVSHSDPALIEAVRRGRREEFRSFQWQGEPFDPQDEVTFRRAKVDPCGGREGEGRILREFYAELIRWRKTLLPLSHASREAMDVLGYNRQKVLFVRYGGDAEEVAVLFHFGVDPRNAVVPLPEGRWSKRLDSAEERWKGPGSPVPREVAVGGELSLALAPHAVVLFTRVQEGTE